MIVTEPHPTNKRMLNILDNGEFWKKMPKSLVVKIMRGQLDCDKTEFLEEEEKVCAGIAADMLLKKMQTSHMLRIGLEKKGFEKGSIDHAIETLSKYGYLNDSRRAEAYIEKLLDKGYGPQYILMKLVTYLGFSKEEAGEYLTMFCDRHKVEQAIEKIVQTSNETKKRRVVEKLLRKGFTYDTLSHINLDD